MEQQNFVQITSDQLSLEKVSRMVASPEAGAISTFSGTTRNNFNGRKVLRLEYEAYAPMAEKEMLKICRKIRSKWDVLKIAMVHRIGEVPIGEASVIIAISSDHRRESLEAVEFAIDELKATVPVWKKEFYEDGESKWKENSECCFTNHTSHHHHAQSSEKS